MSYPRRISRKRAAACLLTLALLLSCAGALATDPPAHRYEGDGFATPEEAVRAYLDGLKAGDLSAMLRAFAIESYVEGFDFGAQVNRVRAYTFSMPTRFPNADGFTRAMNVESYKGFLTDYITYQYLTFHLPELDVNAPMGFPAEDSEGIPALLAQFATLENPAISRMERAGFFAPETFSDRYLSAQIQEHIATMRDIYGAEDLRSMVAGFTVDGTDYLFCCNVIRYGDAWYLSNLGGSIGQLLDISPLAGGITRDPREESTK